jgi:hypothetical protein
MRPLAAAFLLLALTAAIQASEVDFAETGELQAHVHTAAHTLRIRSLHCSSHSLADALAGRSQAGHGKRGGPSSGRDRRGARGHICSEPGGRRV